jgi:DNA-binding MarR family transcriptional regulator
MVDDLRPLGDPGSDDFQVEVYPFYLLNRAVSRYNVVIERELRRIGIDIPTWRVLMILGERQPLRMGHISQMAVINISTMMRIVERMEKARLVTATASKLDGRATEVSLTSAGRKMLSAARTVTAPIYHRAIKGMSATDFRRMLGLLNRLHDNLS